MRKKTEETAEKVPYWEKEEPELLVDKKLQVRLFKEAGALQLAMKGINKQGKEYIKKGVKLRKHILQNEPELLRSLAEILTDWYDELEEDQEKQAG